MFEYSINKEQKARVTDNSIVVSDIVKMYKQFDDKRSLQRSIIDLLKNKLYLQGQNQLEFLQLAKSGFDKLTESELEKGLWKSQLDTNTLYSLAETFKAFMREGTFKNISQVFNVDGDGKEDEEQANTQKEYLLNQLEEMEASEEFKKGIEQLTLTGESNFFVSWVEKYKEVKRQSASLPMLQAKIDKKFKPAITYDELGQPIEQTRMQVLDDNGIMARVKIPVYEGAKITSLDALNLVYDPETYSNWDVCSKIYREFKHANDVLGNKLFKLDSDCKEFLKNVLETSSNVKHTDTDQTELDETQRGKTVELLEFYGDYTYNGRVLSNWSIVVVARKYLVLFESNRFIINPFVNCAPLRFPDSARGVPILYSILGITETQNRVLNAQSDISELKKNPPAYAKKGLFKKLVNKVFPGKVLEYDDALSDKLPIPMQYSNGNDQEIVGYLNELTATISGIFPNMQGSLDSGDVTATEIKTQVAGQTTRLQYQIDEYIKAIIECIKRVADLLADNVVGDYEFATKKAGVMNTTTITDEIRQGDYNYKYNDMSALMRKKAEYQDLKATIEAFANVPEIAQRLDWVKLFDKAMILLGQTDSQELLKTDEEMAMQQMQAQQAQMGAMPNVAQTQSMQPNLDMLQQQAMPMGANYVQ